MSASLSWMPLVGIPKIQLGSVASKNIHDLSIFTALIMWFTYRSSSPIARRLGPIGMNIVTRVMGILVSATAFGLLGRGIGGLLPGLAR